METSRESLRLRGGLIQVTGWIPGPDDEPREARLVLDTGSSNTILDSQFARTLGHGSDRARGIARFISIHGDEPGYTVRLPSLTALGRRVESYLIACQPFPAELGIDGILGLDFFRAADLLVGLRSQVLSLKW